MDYRLCLESLSGPPRFQNLEQEKAEVGQELSQTKETLSTKQEQLKKVRLEVVGLQAKLKSMPKPEPIKPTSLETKPPNP